MWPQATFPLPFRATGRTWPHRTPSRAKFLFADQPDRTVWQFSEESEIQPWKPGDSLSLKLRTPPKVIADSEGNAVNIPG